MTNFPRTFPQSYTPLTQGPGALSGEQEHAAEVIQPIRDDDVVEPVS